MTDPRTIFLSTAGQTATIGRGSDVPMSPETLASIEQQGLKGWRCNMSGSLNSRATPTVTRLEAINGAADADFDAAVAAMLAGRAK